MKVQANLLRISGSVYIIFILIKFARTEFLHKIIHRFECDYTKHRSIIITYGKIKKMFENTREKCDPKRVILIGT